MITQPCLRGIQQFIGRHQSLDDSSLQCFRRTVTRSFEQDGKGLGNSDHPGKALRTARTREQADRYFRANRSESGIVGGHPIVAGEAKLKATAKRCPIDRRDKGLAAGLDLAPDLLQLAATPHMHLRVALAQQHRQVGACHKIVLP